MTTPESQGQNAAAALEHAPVVLSVEVASVTLGASAWAALLPGDVLGTGVKLGEPVVLRANGAVVGRGELCDLDGELAVRIATVASRGGA